MLLDDFPPIYICVYRLQHNCLFPLTHTLSVFDRTHCLRFHCHDWLTHHVWSRCIKYGDWTFENIDELDISIYTNLYTKNIVIRYHPFNTNNISCNALNINHLQDWIYICLAVNRIEFFIKEWIWQHITLVGCAREQ